jgi:hypothetical protein
MKKTFLLILALFLFAENKIYTKCTLNKAQIKCSYYVAKKGDISKISHCKYYANYLFGIKAYGKAAWYYLLSLEPQKAIKSATKALKAKEKYVYEYIADGYLIMHEKEKAKKYYEKFKENVGNYNFFVMKNFQILERIYKDFDKNEALRLLKE